MPHPLRLYEPNRVYEVTSRTIQGRHLLRPSPECNEVIAGVIGRAQHLYPTVEVYGVVVLSNHVTWNLSSPDPEALPRFIGHVNGNISRELGLLHDWPGAMWERPSRPIPILDEQSMVARFRYLLSHGVKEGLVARAVDWPGVTCVPTLLGGAPLYGTWFERDLERQARRRGEEPDLRDFSVPYEVRFARLPCWEHLSDEQYRERVAELVADIEAEAAAKRDRPVVGDKRLVATDPHYRPPSTAHSPAPLCHASTSAARQGFRALYRRFVAAFRQAALLLKAGLRTVLFPPYCFPPGAPMTKPTGPGEPLWASSA